MKLHSMKLVENGFCWKVWDAEFEVKGKGRLATCGGPFLCVFSTKTNQLLMR